MSQGVDNIRCMLIPLHSGRLLLPNAAVVEIIGYRDPEPFDGAPRGVQGLVSWRQRDVPVIDYERLLGKDDQPASIRQRIAVCYAPDSQGRWPLLGVIAQGIPRLLRLSRDTIATASAGPQGDSAIRLRVQVGDESLTVPDLRYLQSAVG